jgi:hypothetical protein
MNINLLSIVKQIIVEYGEDVLADSHRLKAFFSDLAKDEPKSLCLAFGRCVEAGACNALKAALDKSERMECKAAITQRLRDEHGLDPALCAEALDILEMALFEEKKTVPRCVSCGGELREEWKLCPFCGTVIGAKRSETPAVLPIPHITPKSSNFSYGRIIVGISIGVVVISIVVVVDYFGYILTFFGYVVFIGAGVIVGIVIFIRRKRSKP